MSDAKVAESPSPDVSNADLAGKALFEDGYDLAFACDWEAVAVEVNPAWTRILGWRPEEVIGRNLFDFVHPEDVERTQENSKSLPETGTAFRNLRLKTRDGDWRWFEGPTRVLSPTRLLGVLRDVTEQRLREEEQRRTTMQRELLAEKVGVITWTLDGALRTFTRTRTRPAPVHLSLGERLTFDMDTLKDEIHPGDLDHANATLERAICEGGDGAYDVRVRNEAGDGWLTYRVNFQSERVDGRWLIHGLSQDVTALVAARDAAEEAAAEAQGILAEAPFASCIVDRTFHYISVSGAWEAMFGLQSGPFKGRRVGANLPLAKRQRLHRVLKRALNGELYSCSEEELQRPDRTLVLRWQAQPWRAPTGHIRGVIIYANDITDMVAARRAARTNAKRLKLALEAARASVWEVDYANKTFWAGPGFSKLAGAVFTYKEAVRPWPTVYADDRERVENAVKTSDSRNAPPFDARLMHPDGPRWARSHVRITHDAQGRPRKMIGLLQDIDKEKRQAIALEVAERQATVAAEAKSHFLANICHEIRTPMNAVLGVMQIIKREHLDRAEARLLDEALASGRMLTEMLDDMLDFSKIENGQFELHAEPLDPAAVLVGVASLLEPVASAKGLTMKAVAAPDVGLVTADPLRLRQALYNIMGNAVKFTPQGSIEARLTRREGPDGDERLRFEVQDTGIGIPEEFQATLFKRFEQADGSATRKYGGSGLGLAITKRLAEMMGGAVGFTSEPGQGSTFWIEIDGHTVEPLQAAQSTTPDIGDFRVLLVDDNPTNRMVISKILEAFAVKVDTAEDGAEGVALASKGGYDLVLMDIQMPGMDGIEATRRIRAMDGPTGSTPILAVTANVLADQRTSYVDAGMDGVVAKPVSAGALLAEIARVTERSAAA